MELPKEQSPVDEVHAGESNLSKEKQQSLEDFVSEKDTDENLEKLGKVLAKEWKKQPDLSFENFQRKFREKGQ